MKIRIYHKKVKNLDLNKIRILKRMAHKEYGVMKDCLLNSFRKKESKSEIVYAKYNDKIVAWAMIDRDNRIYFRNPWVYYWTSCRYRRRGIGTRIALKVNKLTNKRYHVYQNSNPKFFSHIGK